MMCFVNMQIKSGKKYGIPHRLAPAEFIHGGKASEMHMLLKAPHDSAIRGVLFGGYYLQNQE